ncbi:hypothetical protein LPJ81_003959 [Coemansia sp. IMI 209127]|nr:hypothetical protein LPJ81_003959 [Coemansia sp. IMI 209127]
MVAENHNPSASSSMFSGGAAAAAGAQSSASAATEQGPKAVAMEGNPPGSGSNTQALRQQQDNQPNSNLSDSNATGAPLKNNSSESPLSHGTGNPLGQNTGNRPSSTFSSPYISNASITQQPVSIQQHIGIQQPINSPLVHSSTAPSSAGNIQVMNRLISPPPAPLGAYPKPPAMGSPIVSGAPLTQPDFRRASTASMVYRAPQQMQQQPNPGPLVSDGALQRVGSTGPQPGPAQRQHRMVPSNFVAGMGNQGVPGAGVNPAELGLPNNPAAMAAAAAAAAANQGVNFNGRIPAQAMLAYFQQQQQQHHQQQQQINVPSVPSNDTLAGGRQPPQPNQQYPQQQMNMQLSAAQFSHPFTPMAGMVMSASEQNANNIAGMIQEQNQRYMFQLQMQQGANPPPGVPPVSVGPRSQGNNASPAQNPGDGLVGGGVSSEKGGSGQMASVVRMNAGAVVSPQLIPQQGSPIGSAAPSGAKKTVAKPKAKRTSKKPAKGALASSTAASNALAKSHPVSGTNDSSIAVHQRGGVSAIPVNSALGNNGQYNGHSSSAGSSIANSSPALAIKASSTPAISGINMPATNNVTVMPTNTGPFALAMNGGQIESGAQHSGPMPAGFGDNTFSALLSQKGNRVAMQVNNNGSQNAGGELDHSSVMRLLGGAGGADANELSMQLNPWIGDSTATDAFASILNMGVTMGGGGDAGGAGDPSSVGMSDRATAAMAAAMFSYISSEDGSGKNGGIGGFSSALTMSSIGGGGAGNSGGIGVPVSSVGGGGGSNMGGEATSNIASMVFSPSAASGTKNM